MADKIQKPFQTEINNFRSVNLTDDPANIADDELAMLMNFVPVGKSLRTAPGLSDLVAQVTTGNDVTFLRDFIASNEVFRMAVSNNHEGPPQNRSAFFWDSLWDNQYAVMAVGLYGTFDTAQWKDECLLVINPTTGLQKISQTGSGPSGLVLSTVDGSIKGTCIAVWKNRVWIVNGKTITFSAANSYTDFNPTNGAGSVSDNYESIKNILAATPTQDYLYLRGDYGIHVISGISMTEDAITTFTLSDALPGIGTLYPRACAVYGSSIYMLGLDGVYVISGTSFQIISLPIGTIIDDFMVSAEKAFFANIYGKKTFCILAHITNPENGKAQVWILCFRDSRWFFMMFDDYNEDFTRNFLAAYESSIGTVPAIYAAFVLANGDCQITRLFTDPFLNKTMDASCTRKVTTKFFSFGSAIKDKTISKVGMRRSGTTVSPLPGTLSILGYDNSESEMKLPDNYRDSLPNTRALYSGESNARGKEIAVSYEEYGELSYSINGFVLEGTVGAEW
jgi:hypothetical protein